MTLTLFRWYILLHLIAEEYDAYLIVIGRSRKRQHRAQLRNEVAFQLFLRTEKGTAANIHQQHHDELALLLKHFYKRVGKTGGNIPVYKFYIVAGRVFP